jgi:hypothetical protein
VLERTRVCPISVPRCSSGWVTVTNTDLELEEAGSCNAELGRATRKPAALRTRFCGLTLSDVFVRFDMGLHGRRGVRII